MRSIIAANWKMHHGPDAAREFLDAFLPDYDGADDREVWFFPSAVALEATAHAIDGRTGLRAGAQNVHWEPKGAFTGELSVAMAREAGATAALVGHSERRHVFGETDEETGRKVEALLGGDLTPMLCVGETLDQREAGETIGVVRRQLGAIGHLGPAALDRVEIAYEPVWAIGTGRTATPADADEVHAAIRAWLAERGATKGRVRVLYGGSVKPDNAGDLLAQPNVDGLLVGGASLTPESWLAVCRARID